MIAAVITVGDELLNGQTVDTNSAWLGEKLNEIGVTLSLKLSVGDTTQDIINGLTYATEHAEIILMTGGLGPTNDDITKVALADFVGDQLSFSEETFLRIKGLFESRGRPVLEAHRSQCYMPSTAQLITNPQGTAPGMWIDHLETIILSMPGVPREMKAIMESAGLLKIKSLVRGSHIHHHIIQTAGTGESVIAERIEDIVDTFPPELSIAYLPGLASVKLRLTAKTRTEHDAMTLTAQYGVKIQERLGDIVFGIGKDSLPAALGRLCREKQVTIATAESCTGGGIGHALVQVPGSSAYYLGSIVSYSNTLKENLLNVLQQTLINHGAVSEETVIEMIHGLTDQTGCDVGVAVSGIAGPGGGSAEKPVGTIWLAIGNKSTCKTRKLQLVKNRKINIDYTIITAMNELRLFIEKNF